MSLVKDRDSQYVANTYARFPVEIVSGKGSIVYDETGREYIDMGSGIAVNTFGVSDDEWLSAVTEQMGKLQHMSNLYYTAPCVKLAEMLCEKSGMQKVFFSNSGAEANECAIKTARKYAQEKKGPEFGTVITLRNSFHGRTLATLAATGQDSFHHDFLPMPAGFSYAEAGDMEGIARLAAEQKAAAVMVELVQGEGGVVALEENFVRELAAFADRENVLLIADEVQSGNGRTGSLFAYMRYGVTPDIVTTAKGLAGGLPLGATLLGEKVRDVLRAGDHGSTFGGNPVCCAGAISVLSRLSEEFLAQVRAKADYILRELLGAPGIKSVSGLGLMLGVEPEREASEIVTRCRELGVLVLKAKNKVRLLPALNIPNHLLHAAIAAIKTACGE